jgi:hypothetical protein
VQSLADDYNTHAATVAALLVPLDTNLSSFVSTANGLLTTILADYNTLDVEIDVLLAADDSTLDTHVTDYNAVLALLESDYNTHSTTATAFLVGLGVTETARIAEKFTSSLSTQMQQLVDRGLPARKEIAIAKGFATQAGAQALDGLRQQRREIGEVGHQPLITLPRLGSDDAQRTEPGAVGQLDRRVAVEAGVWRSLHPGVAGPFGREILAPHRALMKGLGGRGGGEGGEFFRYALEARHPDVIFVDEHDIGERRVRRAARLGAGSFDAQDARRRTDPRGL